ncbi:MAG TPA: succinate dehydrogenase assembly factor 2 [Azoarcus taiwanensis]|nr:succinate dehydrogenase assembly factor 2 [Azoarcus taiwanensis]
MSINRGRVRWQCRRALLELDLVFTRFLQEHFDSLDESQLADLDDLLKCEDHDLWAMVNGSKPCAERRWEEMIAMLRAQRAG